MSRVTPKIKKEVDEFINSSYNDNISIITPEPLEKKTLLQHKPAHIDDEDWIQNCRWIVHSIIQLSFDKRNNKPGDYVPLYSKTLKQNCGNNYYVYLEGLLNSGIIECDEKYSKATHESFGFRLSDKYASSPIKHITLTDKFLVRRIRKYRKEKIEELVKTNQAYHMLFSNYNTNITESKFILSTLEKITDLVEDEDNNCIIFHAPPLDEFKDKIYKNKGKCMKYVPVATKCSLNAKTVTFE
jgi:hypothetical protein